MEIVGTERKDTVVVSLNADEPDTLDVRVNRESFTFALSDVERVSADLLGGNDKLTVKAGSTTLATYSNLNKNTGYAQKSFTFTGTGAATSISFSGVEDSSLHTSFVVDDAAVNLS